MKNAKKITKRFLAALALALLIIGVAAALPAKTRTQPANASDNGKCYENCTDPDRPQYDMWGNKFDAYGNLLQVGTCPYSDPISGKPNPYCHTDCQYPDRTTNPVGGCDNSDPCDPANVKGGSGDCTEPSQNTTPPATVNTNQCWGK